MQVEDYQVIFELLKISIFSTPNPLLIWKNEVAEIIKWFNKQLN